MKLTLRWTSALLPLLVLAVGVILPEIAAAQTVDDGLSLETCISCHATGTLVPVSDVGDPADAHYVDLDPNGPETPSTYRQLDIDVTQVDVTGTQVVMEFTVTDEAAAPVTNLFDSDGRFTLARLAPGPSPGDPLDWERIADTTERFTTVGGTFEVLGGGDYRYSSVLDPSAAPIAANDTLRLAIQISASDLPAGNGWCDFDADLVTPNDCTSPVTLTRDIVQTATCNECHGPTTDTKLSFHGGGRTEVEYCVTCHNPGLFGGDTDMTRMVHKIHYGNNLTLGWRGYSDVGFTRDVDNCLSCHGDGGVDEDNWQTVPTFNACESCHDDIDIAAGVGHIPITSNVFCINCHPADGPRTPGILPVATVHEGQARLAEAALYRGAGNGLSVDASYDRTTETITVDYSVARGGVKQVLQSDPRWTNGGSLRLQVGWSTEEFTNEGSGSTPAPAQPVAIDALDVGGAVTDLGGGDYRAVVDVSSFGFGNIAIGVDGHPNADLGGTGEYTRIPLPDALETVSVELRAPVEPRRQVVDIAKCNGCHDRAGAGLTFHGDNRTGNAEVCALCHNPDATDIRRRPADPGTTPDGKREETIDFKRMIHGIHAGADLTEGLVLYGFGGTPHDYSGIDFTANNGNCLTCHLPGTYSTEAASATLASTIDSGADPTDYTDDLNISPVAAACSSCHDDVIAKDHMLANGASFRALDENIHVVPEPGLLPGLLVGSAGLARLGRRRRET